MNAFARFFSDKTVAFYIALGAAQFSLITAVIYAALLGGLDGYVSYIPFVLLVVGAAAFVGLSLLGSCRAGTALMAAADFAAFIVYVGTIYAYPVDRAMSAGSAADIEELPAIIAVGVLIFLCTAASNVLAWIKMRRTKARGKEARGDGRNTV